MHSLLIHPNSPLFQMILLIKSQLHLPNGPINILSLNQPLKLALTLRKQRTHHILIPLQTSTSNSMFTSRKRLALTTWSILRPSVSLGTSGRPVRSWLWYPLIFFMCKRSVQGYYYNFMKRYSWRTFILLILDWLILVLLLILLSALLSFSFLYNYSCKMIFFSCAIFAFSF